MFGSSFFPDNPLNNNFQDLGFDSNNFVSNASDTIPLVILTMLWFLGVLLLYFALRDKNNCISRYITKMETSMRYSSISRFGVELWLSLMVISLIALLNNDLKNVIDIISFTMGLIAHLAFVYLMVYLFVYSYYFFEDIVIYPDHHERHSLMFLEFKRERVEQFFFYPFFMLRRIFIAYVFVGIKDRPLVQCVCLSLSAIIMAIYCIRIRPYESKVWNLLTCFNEVMLSCISLTLFMFLSSDNPEALNSYGYLTDSLLISFFCF